LDSSYECIFLFLQSRDRCLGIEGTNFLYSSFYAKNWNILVPHIKMTPHSETRPSRTLCPPDARLPYRQAAHPAQTKRNASKHQHQRGNGHTRRQARHRRCSQARQQGRSRFRSARKAQNQTEVIAPITEAIK
jgi:hypothetical protein